MPDEYNGTPVPEENNPEPGKTDRPDQIPDWMKEAGWESSSGTFDESKPVFDDLEDEDEIVPADIPAWLEEAAPEGFSFDSEEPAEVESGEPHPEPSSFEMEEAEKGEAPEPPQKDESFEDTPTPSQESREGLDIPSWLEDLELDEDSQETAVAWLENMPESLRATEEELAAARGIEPDQSASLEEQVDDLAWMDDLTDQGEAGEPSDIGSEAELSEDLVAADLIPETGSLGTIYDQEEIDSSQSDIPDWMKQLADEEGEAAPDYAESPDAQPAAGEKSEVQAGASSESMLPDWLSELDQDRQSPAESSPESHLETLSEQDAAEPDENIPEWLGDFEPSQPSPDDQDQDSLAWLENLSAEEETPASPQTSGPESPQESIADLPPVESESGAMPPAEGLEPTQEQPEPESVSPNDDTLNTQIPSWLSSISADEAEMTSAVQSPEPASEQPASQELPPDSERGSFKDSASWLDQIGEENLEEGLDDDSESDVMDWLENLQGDQSPSELDSSQAFPAPETPELETAKYFLEEEETQTQAPLDDQPEAAPVADSSEGDLPDWLSELRSESEEDAPSLEEAIRQSDRELNEAERDFLQRTEEVREDNEDWLSKLEETEDQALPTSTADFPEETEVDNAVAGGMLEHLNNKQGQQGETADLEVPQWLENLKKEEDPQETAVLWLQRFVDQGEEANLHAEIQRYTDELDPGDSIPTWMEDLKNEEDPQTTAMLWLEKLSETRSPSEQTGPQQDHKDESDWLAELEQEEARQEDQVESQEAEELGDSGEGWLADLALDEKLKSADDELPDWTAEETQPKTESKDGEPSWMKATSPLEGDFYTDELAGEEKEVEIPEWLAGYGEGEGPDESQDLTPEQQAEAEAPEEEYAWLSASDAPRPKKQPLDINKAAISQLESILGISYQIAQGIVKYREKHGPYRDIADLMKVPEIGDEQTIEILKPEVFIGEVPEPEPTGSEPSPAEPAARPVPQKQKPESPIEGLLEEARKSLAESNLPASMESYGKLIKKKKQLPEVLEDLQKATLDHPLEIILFKTLGDAYMQSDLLDEALEAYSKAEDLLA